MKTQDSFNLFLISKYDKNIGTRIMPTYLVKNANARNIEERKIMFLSDLSEPYINRAIAAVDIAKNGKSIIILWLAMTNAGVARRMRVKTNGLAENLFASIRTARAAAKTIGIIAIP